MGESRLDVFHLGLGAGVVPQVSRCRMYRIIPPRREIRYPIEDVDQRRLSQAPHPAAWCLRVGRGWFTFLVGNEEGDPSILLPGSPYFVNCCVF